VPSPMILIDFQSQLSENKCSLLFRSVIESRRFNERWHYGWPWVIFEGHFGYCKRFHCLYLKNTAYHTCTKSVTTVGRHNVSNYFYGRIRPEGWCWARPVSDI